jgi:hypothetical protein
VAVLLDAPEYGRQRLLRRAQFLGRRRQLRVHGVERRNEEIAARRQRREGFLGDLERHARQGMNFFDGGRLIG